MRIRSEQANDVNDEQSTILGKLRTHTWRIMQEAPKRFEASISSVREPSMFLFVPGLVIKLSGQT